MSPGHARAARIAYILVVLVATLTNLHPHFTLHHIHWRLHRALDATPELKDAIDAVRNVVLFAGLGAVWVATSRLAKPVRTLTTLTIVSLLLSAGVEALQLFSPVRNSSILDVFTDTTGGLMGGLVTLGAFAIIDEGARKRSYIGIPAVMLAVSYGLATVMEAFIPLFRQDLLPQLGGSIGDRIGRAIDAIRLSSVTVLPLTDAIIFIPAGIFAVVAMVESGMSRVNAAFVTMSAAALLYPAVEVIHGVAAEPILLGAALVHVVAAVCGAIAAATWLAPFAKRFVIRDRARIVAACYVVVIMVWSWRPFSLELSFASMAAQFTAEHLIPLRALSGRADLFSVTDVIAQGVIFFPLGALLAVWPVARKGWLRGVLPAVYIAIILEAGKIPIAGRFMDVTHILIQSAGAALGFVLVRRLGYPVYGTLLRRE
jgi:VanZ family protein